jgi:hypothetical protein
MRQAVLPTRLLEKIRTLPTFGFVIVDVKVVMICGHMLCTVQDEDERESMLLQPGRAVSKDLGSLRSVFYHGQPATKFSTDWLGLCR